MGIRNLIIRSGVGVSNNSPEFLITHGMAFGVSGVPVRWFVKMSKGGQAENVFNLDGQPSRFHSSRSNK